MGSQYFPARSVLFQKEPSGVTYRVPALIYIPHFSCFLAFCEERLTPADAQAHLLVMRKGTFYKNYVEVRLVLIYVDTIITNKLIEYFFLIKKKSVMKMLSVSSSVEGHGGVEYSSTGGLPLNEPLPCLWWVYWHSLLVFHCCSGSHLWVLPVNYRKERDTSLLRVQQWPRGHLELCYRPYQDTHRGHH